MRKIAAAVGAMILAGGAGSAQAQLMDDATMTATFSGMSLIGIYSNGPWFSEIYAPDGTISYVDAANGHLFGEWEVRDGTFCTSYDDGQSACLTAEKVSSNCYIFAEPVGAGKGKGEAEAEPEVVIAWSAIEPSTCDVPSSDPAAAAAPERGK